MNFKKIPREYYPTILDRLTRFEPAYIRYGRVFSDIISKFSLDVKLKDLSFSDEIKYVEEIFNSSVECDGDYSINKLILNLEDKYFKFNEQSYRYLSVKLNISAMAKTLKASSMYSKNLNWIINAAENKDIIKIRHEKNLLYPIEKIILCEGQTEYVLLNSIFKLFNYDLNSNGVIIIAAGGKNQSARKYYAMSDYVNLPFYILLDKDANQIKKIIEAKLQSKDKIFILNSGEFEDVIPRNILINTLNYIHKNELNCSSEDFISGTSTVENLKLIYKKYGFGDFKKAILAQNLKEYIDLYAAKEDFLSSEITQFVNLIKSAK